MEERGRQAPTLTPGSPPSSAPGVRGSLARKGPETPPLWLQGPPLGEGPS